MSSVVKTKFTPLNPINIIENNNIIHLNIEDILPERVGLKAFGLCSIPNKWTPPFFVISSNNPEPINCLEGFLKEFEISSATQLIVRSSGIDESIDDRGSLESQVCNANDVLLTILNLKSVLLSRYEKLDLNKIHWVIQIFISPQMKGHLSNERRLSKVPRDWITEIEGSGESSSERNSLSIRAWRDSRIPEITELNCEYRMHYADSLKSVAVWAYNMLSRLHFEWVWDGRTMYIVQADECDAVEKGVNPTTLVKEYITENVSEHLNLFSTASEGDYKVYRKLKNAKLYRELGYKGTKFYILKDAQTLSKLLNEAQCSTELISDLEQLTKQPLVIRTDGTHIPSKHHQMLPRSDELRSTDDAVKWLIEVFREKILSLDIKDSGLCLIAHHFIPASASAWCLAHPDKRKVRIESLWGIPEGLYWYPHDVYDVDTKLSTISASSEKPGKFIVRERLRYKDKFIAPNNNGQWVLHQTSKSFDWKATINKQEWINEIAWTSRIIANKLNQSVVIMWFIDVNNNASSSPVIPWYHEFWDSSQNSPVSAPKKKNMGDAFFSIKTRNDWKNLKGTNFKKFKISRILIDPMEPELVRDPEFAKELADLAKRENIVVELAGGILSHAYYLLTKMGCKVECADLYAADEEEIEYNKLVRDKIPEFINSQGEDVRLIKLKSEALISAMKRKVVEESLEVFDAKTSDEIIEEIADLQEIINALTKELKISNKEIERVRKAKKAKRGGFDNGIMLGKTALGPSLSLSDEGKSNFEEPTKKYEQTISKSELLPPHPNDFHSDKRHDNNGIFERQLRFSLPIYGDDFSTPNSVITLENNEKKDDKYIFTLQMERSEGVIKCKVRIVSAPTQLSLEL
ncbi:TPA: hypothetical protein ACPZQF_002995 [Yersinia enterocolitica]